MERVKVHVDLYSKDLEELTDESKVESGIIVKNLFKVSYLKLIKLDINIDFNNIKEL